MLTQSSILKITTTLWGQVNGQIMTEAAETGEQYTNHLVELPNILMCKDAGKLGITDTPESDDVNLEDNTL